MSNKIYVFGDSVLKGVILDEVRQKYKVIADSRIKDLSDMVGHPLVNRSMFGATIDKAKQIIQRTFRKKQDCKVAVLEFGGNDSNFDWPAVSAEPKLDHKPQTLPEDFAEKYEQLILDLQSKHIPVIIMNLPPVDSELYLNYLVEQKGLSRENLLTFLGDTFQISRFQELYSNLAEKVALKTGAFLVDVRSKFLNVKNYRKYMCADGLHPSREGHELIYEAFQDFIEQSSADVLASAAV